MKNSADLYKKCYDILVEHLHAKPEDYESFIQYLMEEDNFPKEYRFCGILGFGGKFWRNDGKLYVSCYREDETPVRMRKIKKVNQLLSELVARTSV